MKSAIAKSPNVVLRKKESQLYLDINFQGKRKREYLKIKLTGRKEEDKMLIDLAKRIMSKRSYELHSDENNEINREKQKANFIEYFEILAREQFKTPNSWTDTLKHIRNYAGDVLEFGKINSEWIDGFKTYLLKQVSQNSAATYYGTFKTSLNKAVRQKYILVNPANQTDNIIKKRTVRNYLNLEELTALNSTPLPNHEVVKKAFLFSCFTGLRISDVKALKWQNIKNDKICLTQVKTGDEISIPISKQALIFLSEPGENKDFVFQLKGDEHTRRAIKKWMILSCIDKNISFHTARHTFATLSLTFGVDIYTVSKLLGHSDVKTTTIYAKLIDKKKEEAVMKLPML